MHFAIVQFLLVRLSTHISRHPCGTALPSSAWGEGSRPVRSDGGEVAVRRSSRHRWQRVRSQREHFWLG
jgi:hypothetical protein